MTFIKYLIKGLDLTINIDLYSLIFFFYMSPLLTGTKLDQPPETKLLFPSPLAQDNVLQPKSTNL